MPELKFQSSKEENSSLWEVNEKKSCSSFNRYGKGFIAELYQSGFPLSHDTYNGISCASDGKIYYVLCSVSKDQGGKMYCFDPSAKKISYLGDLTEICGEKGSKAIPQGKSHVAFYEMEGKLFFSTHVGYYTPVDDMETMGAPPEGHEPYPGGHILSYDLATKKFIDYGIAREHEGILAMNMDTARGIIYGITWPSGFFFRFDIKKKELKNLGTISHNGEKGSGENYRVLCRTIAINPDDGAAYFSVSEGDIYKCGSDAAKPELVGEGLLKIDYFGQYKASSPGHMAYNWRQVLWHEGHKLFYGVHGNSGYLFSFDPQSCRVELLERLTSVPSRKCGMYDQFSYGYLGFTLGSDGQTIFYLTGAPVYENGKRVLGKSSTGKGEAKGIENLHLITFNLSTKEYSDHGPVFYKNGKRPLYVNSITIGPANDIYFLGRISEEDDAMSDLISIRNPLEEPELQAAEIE